MSKREEILAQRDAFLAGVNWGYNVAGPKGSQGGHITMVEVVKRYPLTEKRARVVMIGGTEYRVTDGKLYYRLRDDRWEQSGTYCAERLAFYEAVRMLLANPTEEVEL